MQDQRHMCHAWGALNAAVDAPAHGRMRWHGWCCAVLMCVIASACVLPPPIDEMTPDQNHPPTITPLFPTRDGQPVQLNCDPTRPTQFSANIDDPDPRDTLYYRFFVDYYRLTATDRLATIVTSVPPQRVRPPVDTYIASNNATIAEHPGDVHVIELLVADREFDDANPDVAASEVARVPVEGGLTASYQWVVNPVVCN